MSHHFQAEHSKAQGLSVMDDDSKMLMQQQHMHAGKTNDVSKKKKKCRQNLTIPGASQRISVLLSVSLLAPSTGHITSAL